MIEETFLKAGRPVRQIALETEFVVVGGGMAGTCAAITAARQGSKVILVQDRPVLGGNGSSEVRLWILGATSHLGNNNRWAREGGVIDEILVENLYRNKEGNALILDTIVLEKVLEEPNITLLLNTAAYEVEKSDPSTISKVRAFCSQNSTRYELSAPLFCDASGDGLVAFAAGAAFRMGAESKEEFGELFAPDKEYGELLGHTIYFYSKDVGKPIDYVAPSFALKDITQLPKFRNIDVKDNGCLFWWVEYGGSLDTVHDSETIKWELWKIVYGIWDYIKNSGKFPEARNMTLEWVGTIPGKRESRRFEGDYMLKQQDVVERPSFDDAVAFGGWAVDLHPSDAVYSDLPSCTQWHSKGVYQIPYRSYYSKNIDNLFLAGRIISATHVAFGSSRVIATCALGGQAAGMAAAHCIRDGLKPRDLLSENRMEALQNSLNREGQSIPRVPSGKDGNLMDRASVHCSSVETLAHIPPSKDKWLSLEFGAGQWVPLKQGTAYTFTCQARCTQESQLEVKLRTANGSDHFTPELLIESKIVPVAEGEQEVEISFAKTLERDRYALLSFHSESEVEIKASDHRFSGVVSAFRKGNKAVSNNGAQEPPEGIGIDAFEFWCPLRRPGGENLALHVDPPLNAYGPDLLKNGYTRPTMQTNAWVAELKDPEPQLTLSWQKPIRIKSIFLYWDTDFDHPMESSQWGHPERVIPFCVRNYRILNGCGKLIYEEKDNYQTIDRVTFGETIETDELILQLDHPSETIPAGLFGLRVYAD